MITEEPEELRKALDKTWFEVEKAGGHLDGLTIEQYQELLYKERKIAKDPKARNVPVEEVIQDIQRYGTPETRLMIKAFLEYTLEQTRKASVAGRHEKAVYLATGALDIRPYCLELGLVSAHTPGGSGGGGWGFKGIRRLALSHIGDYIEPIGGFGGGWWGFIKKVAFSRIGDYTEPIDSEEPADPERWLKNVDAFVEESYGEKLAYQVLKSPDAKTILYLLIENARRMN